MRVVQHGTGSTAAMLDPKKTVLPLMSRHVQKLKRCTHAGHSPKSCSLSCTACRTPTTWSPLNASVISCVVCSVLLRHAVAHTWAARGSASWAAYLQRERYLLAEVGAHGQHRHVEYRPSEHPTDTRFWQVITEGCVGTS